MTWSASTIVALIEQGVILIPKFIALWASIGSTFAADDKAAVDVALAAARQRDAEATAQARIDLDEAAQRTE